MSDRAPLLPDDWANLSPLVDRLLDATVSERPALLDEMARDNPTRRAALERLVADCERDGPLLERPAFERFSHLREEDAEPVLPEVLGGRYRIDRELGRGGMARVYLAHDSRHDRRVAVKVIRHEIASSLGHDRFLREIGIAARLRHPNIMPLYDSGDVDGLLYFVMPYEEGKSLRARLDRKEKLGVAEVVSILRDVARALACAHEQGVVHRDIKPDNVMLSGDAAVVTDFGIAKALTIAATETGTGFTQAGTVIGTPTYMSPEQAIGDPTTDHRADIYAFGCLAYELFAGAPPFTGTTTHEIISAKLSQPLKPLTDHRPDAPHAIARLIARCLEKDPAVRPASASELLDVLGAMPAASEPAVRRRRWFPKLAAAAVALSVLVLAAWYALALRGGPVTIAVLPLLHVTGDSQSVAEAFSDDLATALSKVRWLAVKSRIGASNYSGRGDIAPSAVGDSLGARYLVTGSFRQDRDSTAVTLQLISSEDGAVVWAEKFTQPLHLEELRDSIVRMIASKLRPEARRFANRFPVETTRPQYATSDDAYTLYLRGKKKLTERGKSIDESILFFRRAIALDSNSAQAWSGLSLALAISAVSQNASVDSVRPEAVRSARQAMRLDSSHSEPHVAMAVVHSLDRQWAQAEQEFKTALRLNPQDLEARIQYTRVLFAQARLAAAHQQIDAARETDPASSLVLGFKGSVFFLQGANDSALVWSNRAMRTDSANFVANIFRAMLLLRLNRGAEARQLVRNAPPFEPYALYVRAVTGDSAEVRQKLKVLGAGGNLTAAPETARAYALLGLGDTPGALEALQRATDAREIWPNISPEALPVFDAVRNNPRFQALRKQVGLSAP